MVLVVETLGSQVSRDDCGPSSARPSEPPPGVTESGSWRWVWVPDRPDVRDSGSSSYRAGREESSVRFEDWSFSR